MLEKKQYAGVEFISESEADKILSKAIDSNDSFFAGRVGGTEMKTIHIYDNPFHSLKDFRLYTNTICELSGFFPKKIIKIKEFCDTYKKSMMDIDYLGAFYWPGEEDSFRKSNELKFAFTSKVLDPFSDNSTWYDHLEGKRVLIVHPFTDTINEQYKNREHIYISGGRLIPQFELQTVKAVQSLGGKGAVGFKNWFEALDTMKSEVSKKDFEIALMGCGAYGIPLGSFIKDMGRQVVYVGGCLQLLFGILGNRWEKEERVMKYVNEFWVRPSKSEIIKNADLVENSCYW